MTASPQNSNQSSVPMTTHSKSTVGSVMNRVFPAISSTDSLELVISQLPRISKQANSINYLYVVDDLDKLLGVISIKELFAHHPSALVKNVMESKLVVCSEKTSKKRVAYLAVKNNLKAIPVVNKNGQIVGVFSNDGLLSLLFNQYKDSLRHFAGVISFDKKFDTIIEHGVLRDIISRLPWISMLFVG